MSQVGAIPRVWNDWIFEYALNDCKLAKPQNKVETKHTWVQM
jgi:hypothetical protein